MKDCLWVVEEFWLFAFCPMALGDQQRRSHHKGYWEIVPNQPLTTTRRKALDFRRAFCREEYLHPSWTRVVKYVPEER
jgi:hypothetical protein